MTGDQLYMFMLYCSRITTLILTKSICISFINQPTLVGVLPTTPSDSVTLKHINGAFNGLLNGTIYFDGKRLLDILHTLFLFSRR